MKYARPEKDALSIHLDNLTLGYRRHPAVHHVSGVFRAGSLTAVAGPNGAGKSTLLKGIAGILSPLQGQIRFVRGRDRTERQRVLAAYLPQQAAVDRSFPIALFDFAALGLWPQIGGLGRLREHHRRAVQAALDEVGLQGFERRTLDSLSGGQMQRALFARLLLLDAPVVLLDEPFNAIDAVASARLLTLAKRWSEAGRVVLAVSHDLAQIRAHFPHTLLLGREAIAWGSTTEVLTDDNLARAQALSAAFDDHAAICAVPETVTDHGRNRAA